MSLMRFVEKWTTGDYPPSLVSEEELHEVEKKLRSRLPEAYTQSVLTVGLPQPSIALLETIVDQELDIHSIGDFYSPSEIIDETLGWREIGMPQNLIAFAGDGCGNKFCFDTEKGGSKIWFFDHDFDTVELIADSFDEWLTALCNIAP